MSMLKSLMVDTKSAWVEYPGLNGFEVEVVNLSRPEIIKLRKSCVVTKFDKKTRQPQEELDDERFVAKFTKATIKNWKGLKAKHLEELLLVDISNTDPESEIPYSQEDAEELVKNSGDFDQWLNDTVFDLEHFRSTGDRAPVEAA